MAEVTPQATSTTKITASSEASIANTRAQYIAGKLRQEKKAAIMKPAQKQRERAREKLEIAERNVGLTAARAKKNEARQQRDKAIADRKKAPEGEKALYDDVIKQAKEAIKSARKEEKEAKRSGKPEIRKAKRETRGQRLKANLRLVLPIARIAAGEMKEPLAKLGRAERVRVALGQSSEKSVVGFVTRFLPGGLSEVQRESISLHHQALEELAKEGKKVGEAKFGERVIDTIVAGSTVQQEIMGQITSDYVAGEIQRIGQLGEGKKETARAKLGRQLQKQLQEIARLNPSDEVAQEFFGSNSTTEERQAIAEGLIDMCIRLGPTDFTRIREEAITLEKTHKGSGYFADQYSLGRGLLEQGSRTGKLIVTGVAIGGLIVNPFTAVPAAGIFASGITTFLNTQLKTRYDRGIALIDEARNQQQSNNSINLLQKIWGDVNLTAEESEFNRQVMRISFQRAGISMAMSFLFGAGGHAVVGGALGHAGEAMHGSHQDAVQTFADQGRPANFGGGAKAIMGTKIPNGDNPPDLGKDWQQLTSDTGNFGGDLKKTVGDFFWQLGHGTNPANAEHVGTSGGTEVYAINGHTYTFADLPKGANVTETDKGFDFTQEVKVGNQTLDVTFAHGTIGADGKITMDYLNGATGPAVLSPDSAGGGVFNPAELGLHSGNLEFNGDTTNADWQHLFTPTVRVDDNGMEIPRGSWDLSNAHQHWGIKLDGVQSDPTQAPAFDPIHPPLIGIQTDHGIIYLENGTILSPDVHNLPVHAFSDASGQHAIAGITSDDLARYESLTNAKIANYDAENELFKRMVQTHIDAQHPNAGGGGWSTADSQDRDFTKMIHSDFVAEAQKEGIPLTRGGLFSNKLLFAYQGDDGETHVIASMGTFNGNPDTSVSSGFTYGQTDLQHFYDQVHIPGKGGENGISLPTIEGVRHFLVSPGGIATLAGLGVLTANSRVSDSKFVSRLSIWSPVMGFRKGPHPYGSSPVIGGVGGSLALAALVNNPVFLAFSAGYATRYIVGKALSSKERNATNQTSSVKQPTQAQNQRQNQPAQKRTGNKILSKRTNDPMQLIGERLQRDKKGTLLRRGPNNTRIANAINQRAGRTENDPARFTPNQAQNLLDGLHDVQAMPGNIRDIPSAQIAHTFLAKQQNSADYTDEKNAQFAAQVIGINDKRIPSVVKAIQREAIVQEVLQGKLSRSVDEQMVRQMREQMKIRVDGTGTLTPDQAEAQAAALKEGLRGQTAPANITKLINQAFATEKPNIQAVVAKQASISPDSVQRYVDGFVRGKEALVEQNQQVTPDAMGDIARSLLIAFGSNNSSNQQKQREAQRDLGTAVERVFSGNVPENVAIRRKVQEVLGVPQTQVAPRENVKEASQHEAQSATTGLEKTMISSYEAFITASTPEAQDKAYRDSLKPIRATNVISNDSSVGNAYSKFLRASAEYMVKNSASHPEYAQAIETLTKSEEAAKMPNADLAQIESQQDAVINQIAQLAGGFSYSTLPLELQSAYRELLESATKAMNNGKLPQKPSDTQSSVATQVLKAPQSAQVPAQQQEPAGVAQPVRSVLQQPPSQAQEPPQILTASTLQPPYGSQANAMPFLPHPDSNEDRGQTIVSSDKHQEAGQFVQPTNQVPADAIENVSTALSPDASFANILKIGRKGVPITPMSIHTVGTDLQQLATNPQIPTPMLLQGYTQFEDLMLGAFSAPTLPAQTAAVSQIKDRLPLPDATLEQLREMNPIDVFAQTMHGLELSTSYETKVKDMWDRLGELNSMLHDPSLDVAKREHNELQIQQIQQEIHAATRAFLKYELPDKDIDIPALEKQIGMTVFVAGMSSNTRDGLQSIQELFAGGQGGADLLPQPEQLLGDFRQFILEGKGGEVIEENGTYTFIPRFGSSGRLDQAQIKAQLLEQLEHRLQLASIDTVKTAAVRDNNHEADTRPTTVPHSEKATVDKDNTHEPQNDTERAKTIREETNTLLATLRGMRDVAIPLSPDQQVLADEKTDTEIANLMSKVAELLHSMSDEARDAIYDIGSSKTFYANIYGYLKDHPEFTLEELLNRPFSKMEPEVQKAYQIFYQNLLEGTGDYLKVERFEPESQRIARVRVTPKLTTEREIPVYSPEADQLVIGPYNIAQRGQGPEKYKAALAAALRARLSHPGDFIEQLERTELLEQNWSNYDKSSVETMRAVLAGETDTVLSEALLYKFITLRNRFVGITDIQPEWYGLIPLQVLAPSSESFKRYVRRQYPELAQESDESIDKTRRDIVEAELQHAETPMVYQYLARLFPIPQRV